MPRRVGYKWTVNETLALQREQELLGMSIKEIAKKHERSEVSILFKLDEIAKYEKGFKDIVSYASDLPRGMSCIFSEV